MGASRTLPRCVECSSPTTPDQRYCLECGAATQRAPRPAELCQVGATATPAGAATAGEPPALRALATAAMCVLGVGLLIGSGLGESSLAGPPSAGVTNVALAGSGASDEPRASPGDDDVASENVPTSDPGGGAPIDAPGDVGTAPAVESGPGEQDIAPDAPAAGQDEGQAPDAEPLSGAVVHVRPRSYVVALEDGRLRTVHSKDAAVPQVGDKVDQSGERLHNGTYRGAGFVVVGSETRTTIRGNVPFVDPAKGVYAVSSPGVSMLVRGPAASLPTVGDAVVVRIRIVPADPARRAAAQLVQEAIDEREKATDPLDLAGKLEAIDSQRRTLVVPADDLDESQKDLGVAVPNAIDLTSFRVGDELALTVRVLPGGALELTGASDNESADAADDGARAIGDQAKARR